MRLWLFDVINSILPLLNPNCSHEQTLSVTNLKHFLKFWESKACELSQSMHVHVCDLSIYSEYLIILVPHLLLACIMHSKYLVKHYWKVQSLLVAPNQPAIRPGQFARGSGEEPSRESLPLGCLTCSRPPQVSQSVSIHRAVGSHTCAIRPPGYSLTFHSFQRDISYKEYNCFLVAIAI